MYAKSGMNKTTESQIPSAKLNDEAAADEADEVSGTN